MRRRSFRYTWVAIGFAGLCAACSVLLSSPTDQCATSADCAHFTSFPVCQDGVCVAKNDHEDGAPPAPDAPGEGAGGDAGCPPIDPDAAIDFTNGCTNSQCIPFDNCARLHMCDEAATLPSLIDPPDANPPPADAGPDTNDASGE